MATILCIETTTTNCSVALGKDGKLLSLREDGDRNYSHAEKLHVFIDELLTETSLEPSDLDAIAVSMGPGSYTGLRIGVSAAKGLCFSLGVPLISTSTLLSLAKQIDVPENALIVPMLDARRMEVYSAVFDAAGNEMREIQAQILDENSFSAFLAMGKVYFLGDGTDKFKNVQSHPNAVFVTGKFPSAKEMIHIAEEKHKKSDTEDVAYFEPFYLKDFISR